MKTYLFLVLGLMACSVETKQIEPKASTTTTPTTTPTEATPHVVEPNKGICSYGKDPDKGCLKASISFSELHVGDFDYNIGVKSFARQFPKDLTDSGDLGLLPTETLAFDRQVTVSNFYSNFSIFIEGSHTSYSAYNTGLGNLQVNNMAVGHYNILVAKEFDLKVLDQQSRTTGYRCAIIWARRSVEVLAGEETPLSEEISEFELEPYRDSCSGRKRTSLDPIPVVLSTTPTPSIAPTPSSTPTPSIHPTPSARPTPNVN